MDHRRFDALTRSFATPKTRRGLLGGLAAFAVGAGLGARGTAGAQQVTQAYCGNQTCIGNACKCKPGCVCCTYTNGNSRCRPPGTCSPGTESTCPPPTTTTTAAPTTTTTTTTTTLPPNPDPSCAGATCDTFAPCSENDPTCVCASLYGGGGLCFSGQTLCFGLPDCDASGGCATGFLCAVETCCNRPVCLPADGACDAPTAARISVVDSEGGTGPTIASR